MKCRLKKSDQVQIITGKDVGKRGRILEIQRLRGRVLVEGLNLVKKNLRRRSENEKGGIIDIEAPLDISNVMIVCRKCNGPVRMGIRIEGKGMKSRLCKKCGEIL